MAEPLTDEDTRELLLLLLVVVVVVAVIGWLLNVPATYSCILGMDLLRQYNSAATLRQKSQVKLTPGQLFKAPILSSQAPNRVATGIFISKSLV